jgi:hypothetical protein
MCCVHFTHLHLSTVLPCIVSYRREFKTKNDEIQKRLNEAVQLQNSLQQVRTRSQVLSSPIWHPIVSIPSHSMLTDCSFSLLSLLPSLLSLHPSLLSLSFLSPLLYSLLFSHTSPLSSLFSAPRKLTGCPHQQHRIIHRSSSCSSRQGLSNSSCCSSHTAISRKCITRAFSCSVLCYHQCRGRDRSCYWFG